MRRYAAIVGLMLTYFAIAAGLSACHPQTCSPCYVNVPERF